MFNMVVEGRDFAFMMDSPYTRLEFRFLNWIKLIELNCLERAGPEWSHCPLLTTHFNVGVFTMDGSETGRVPKF